MGGLGKILIIGAGPAGLGAAWRLHEAGHTNWELFEKDSRVGGLAASHVDASGFTWDLGGHVVFSHYAYFDYLLDSLLEHQWVRHERQAWIWMRERFIPYPLQNNIRHLPTPELIECLEGLLDAQGKAASCENFGLRISDCGLGTLDSIRNPQSAIRNQTSRHATFADWIVHSFGAGLARVFFNPYNFKVWATDPARMSSSWVGERVAAVDLKRILRNIIEGRDDLGWGPNATFRFPLHGGTGRIWQAIAERLPAGRLHLGAEVTAIDGQRKIVHLRDGTAANYDWLITTMPLDHLVSRISDLAIPGGSVKAEGLGDGSLACAEDHRQAALDDATLRNPQSLADQLRYSSTHVVGVGLAGPVPERLATKCWIYFPEPQLPFYRVTVFSNYSPNNVAQPGRQWSLMAEVSESADKPVDRTCVVRQTIDGLKGARLLGPEAAVESVWHQRIEHGYPTPSLQRDALLDQIEPVLYLMKILSRGRFGAWKYEVGNMDHSFMQGVEAVNHVLFGEPEVTLRSPAVVNAPKPTGRRGG
ncbi:MAG: FAD-dependent oxidoreductase [Phycisphaerae bacterium]|nr:FAD-dependent oxidoreductase [Phycisphaerae bacterium]